MKNFTYDIINNENGTLNVLVDGNMAGEIGKEKLVAMFIEVSSHEFESVILSFTSVDFIDFGCCLLLWEIRQRYYQRNKEMLFADLTPRVYEFFTRAGFPRSSINSTSAQATRAITSS